MTLVLYLRYNDGIILMADTIGINNGEKYPDVHKISTHEENNISVVYAVSGKSVSSFFNMFLEYVRKNISTLSGRDFFKQILKECIEVKRECAKWNRYTLDIHGDPNFSMKILILRKNESDIDCALIDNFTLKEDFQCLKNFAMGIGRQYIEPNLRLHSEEKSKDEVLRFGYYLMKYAHDCNDVIGDPEVDGCDYIIVSNTEDLVYVEGCKPQQKIDLERILYRFEEKDASKSK